MTTTAPPAAPPAAAQGFDRRKLFAFLCMVFGMFMAILDIQIVSASLADIQAGLSASADEIPWVQTSYLIAEVIMIPLSGFLSRLLSTRWLFSVSAAGFTLMSLMCATATNIEQMIVWRALQGFIGGGMIPSVFAAAFTIFPPSKRAFVSPMIGLVATLAPTIGPTVGGYLTDLFSWHWLFLINIVPGIFVTISTWTLVDFDEPNFALFDHFDWLGLASMAGFLGCLEYVLEEGPANDWFQDEAILIAAAICAVSALVFFWRALTRLEPIVDLRAFTDRNFAVGSLCSFVMGIGLYGLTYLYPVYLGRVRGYSALQIGETMFVTGLCMFLTAPIAGRLSQKLDPRVMMAMGFTGFAAGTWIVSGITHDWDFWELLLPQILRGVSLMMCMVPINNIALGTLHPSRMKNASGLFNLTRNLGGAVGLAIINTTMNDRWDLHLERLREAVTWSSTAALERLDALTRGFQAPGVDAATMALKAVAQTVRREALVMAFGDVFLLLTFLFLALALATPFIRKPGRPAGAGGGGH
ncbi:DHA2 family efflux MFS transporter permease subunit [Azospirillum sp. RWY-5-1]|uniref:DHA2 family efflux MFS transporter permease subunit n=1 Tax=Azospirillum oleiclasticum TaxID=2735135 RepID=A0ABX2TA67_9PROT|nr:DHA2 family efflux MFS transporter permease subunit [Azospirillum oleiclasticum]NYZ12734.1 DHA2 family efflux MFS transporter permease subunit [Azospirillum oleiclasticum]NYZ19894.1 DHA2 family efflux MFS transporter permease subunit [Azospirillum oleiclasticum]